MHIMYNFVHHAHDEQMLLLPGFKPMQATGQIHVVSFMLLIQTLFKLFYVGCPEIVYVLNLMWLSSF